MDHPEFNGGVDAAGGRCNLTGVADGHRPIAGEATGEPAFRHVDHRRVDIERLDVRGVQAVEQNFHADTATTAHFKDPLTGEVPPPARRRNHAVSKWR